MTTTNTGETTGPAADEPRVNQPSSGLDVQAAQAHAQDLYRRYGEATTETERVGILEELAELIEQLLAALLELQIQRPARGVPERDERWTTAYDLADRSAINRRAVRAGGRPTHVGIQTRRAATTDVGMEMEP